MTLEEFVTWIIHTVESWGYIGIFIMTFVESSFVPMPAEVTMIPAGYLVHQGELDFMLTLLVSTLGTLGGALFNYWIALRWGEGLLIRYGKYLMIKPEKLVSIERYFASHGAISVFTGRLVPGLKHYISFPAGLARMALGKFCVYTTLGGGLWMAILLSLGYFLGENKHLVKEYLLYIKVGLMVGIVALVVGYLIYNRRSRSKESTES